MKPKVHCKAYPIVRKALLAMNLTGILILAVSLHVSADLYSQKVSISSENADLKSVFQELREQTGYYFMFNNRVLKHARPVSVTITDKPLPEALDKLFHDQPFSYTIKDRVIVVSLAGSHPRTAPAPEPEKVAPIQQQITGKVTDSTGTPLPGVSVVVKDRTIGTMTNLEGDYELGQVPDNAVLVFSFVGFRTQEVPVSGRTVINVVLTEDIAELDRLVVVGYGVQKKATITGSIASVDEKTIKSVTTTDLSKGLAGRLPGIRVVQNSSEPGSFDTRFDIRGFADPLFIVDGMEMSKRDFVRLNPNIIEDISILKDASAAVFGVKAANGVVLVTTKKGSIGKPVINYAGDFEIQKFTNTLTPLDAYNFAVLNTEAEINNGISPSATTFSPEDIEAYRNGTLPSTNWYDLVTRPYSTKHRHNLSASGGSEAIQYFASLGYLDEEGMWKSGDLNYQKYDLGASITGRINDNLKVGLSVTGMQDEKNEPGAPAFLPGIIGSMYFSLFMQVPTNPVYANNNPNYLQDSYDGQHPLAISHAEIGGYTKTQLRTFQGNFTIDYDVPFINGMKANFRYGHYNLEQYSKRWAPRFQMYTYNEDTGEYLNTATKNDPPNLTGDYTSMQRSTVYGQLNYARSFEVHNLNATVVYEQKRLKNDNLRAYSEFDANVDQFFAGTSNHTITANNIFETANQNIITKVNYDFASRYLLEAGFNFGGSSLFPAGSRWGFFPYASAGWVLSEEPFFKNQFPLISQLKIRGSWGKMGDDAAAAFQFLEGYDYPSGTYVFDDKITRGLGFRSIPNRNLTWTTSVVKNVGLDFDLGNRIFYLSLDLFQRDRSGLLATRTTIVPGTIGQALSQENLNSDMIRGVELMLGHSKRQDKFSYDVAGNISFTRGKMTHVERNPDANSWENWRNNPTDRWTNIVWGYQYIGQFQTYEEIVNSPLQGNLSQGNRLLKPGDLKYRDINNDGVINHLDQVPIARGNTPEINFGLSASASYKQFDVSVLFQGAANVNYLNDGPWYAREAIHWVNRNGLMKFTDRWHREDLFDLNSPWVPGRYPSTYSMGPQSPSTPSNTANSAFWVNNSSYLRLKSVEIGYTFTNNFIEKLGASSLRLVVSGFNLVTWTGLEDVDPERLQNLIYPITRTFNFGVNLQL